MKTAVIIPDDIFERADRLAAERRVSRSQLYAEALRRYLQACEEVSPITEALNRVYAIEDSTMDPAVLRAQAEAIGPGDW